MLFFTRRQFIKSSSIFVGGTALTGLPQWKKKGINLSFSTLGCPDWTFLQITDFAVQHGYRGIELRGLQREMDLIKCPEFSKANIGNTLSIMKDKGLEFVNLGSSANMHTIESAGRKKQLDEARRFIDLAHQLHCPYVRVFPNTINKEKNKTESLDLIANGLMELGKHAKGSHVSVLMETHGDVVHTDDILYLMKAAGGKHVGLVWDFTNMWSVTREPVSQAYQLLKKYIRHTHVKDMVMTDGKINYTLLGKGEVPVLEALDILYNDGYKGYYSFEWEKLWHPEIAEPEIALADFPVTIKKHFKLNT